MTVYAKVSEEDINELETVAVAVGVEVKHLRTKIKRLEAINAELLRALQLVTPWAVKGVEGHVNQAFGKRALDVAYAVIEMVEAES